MTRIAINGMGRIGRAVLRILLDDHDLEIVAINDIVDVENLAYLIAYDSVYGPLRRSVEVVDNSLVVDGRHYRTLSEADPSRLPWRDLAVDLVLECTGKLTTEDQLRHHLEAGAARVILSAPSPSETVPTVVPGVNRLDPGSQLISCASCTTNCIAPVIEVVSRRLGVERAIMTTIHAYTGGQRLIDGPHKRFRRGRAGAANLVPTSTGAARATGLVVPDLAGRFDGVAVRAPVPVGSLVDIVFVAGRPTTVEEVNELFHQEAATDRYRGILGISHDPLVSTDIIGDPRASVVDAELTQVVDGTLVKVMAWYDNEWGFSHQMLREARRLVEAS